MNEGFIVTPIIILVASGTVRVPRKTAQAGQYVVNDLTHYLIRSKVVESNPLANRYGTGRRQY